MAMNVSSSAATVTASFTPCTVPLDMASSRLSPLSIVFTFMVLSVFSFWGTMILANTMAAGAAMTEAESR